LTVILDCLLHVHSSFSYDSKTDLADIAVRARKEGIDCVLMSEHNNFLDAKQVSAFVERCASLSDERLLIVPGLELSLDENRVHLLAYGIREYVASSAPGTSVGVLVRRIHELGGLAVLAHPSHKEAFNRVSAADLDVLDGMEIWNVKNGNRFCPDATEIEYLTRVRSRTPRVLGFAGLDLHSLPRFERLVCRVEADRRDAQSVLAALRAGKFVIQGPLVAVRPDGAGGIRLAGYRVLSRAMKSSKRTLYGWQARLEKRGWTTPRIVSRAARKLF
jgi:hypothetical protein